MDSDDEELHEFLTSRYPSLRRSAFLMGGDWRLADELTVTTLANFVTDRRRGTVVDPDAYVFGDLMAAFQHRPPRREHIFIAPDDLGAPDDEDTGTDQVRTLLVLDALHRLSPRCRAVVVLRHWDGFDVEETADLLGLADERVAAYEAAGLAVLDDLLEVTP